MSIKCLVQENIEYTIPELHNLSIECKDMENNMQHRCLFVILFDIPVSYDNHMTYTYNNDLDK